MPGSISLAPCSTCRQRTTHFADICNVCGRKELTAMT
jgi:hypothetical protein